MDFREYLAGSRAFVARHRIASAVAAPAALGVAAAVAASLALTSSSPGPDPRLTTSVTECRDMVTISVAGRNDTPTEGTTKMLVDANGRPLPAAMADDYHSEWVDPVVNAPSGTVGADDYAAIYIAYPADMDSYEEAVNTGVANTESVMRQIAQACPDTRFSIVGYSEGADVVRRVAMKIGNQEAEAGGGYGIVDPADVVGVVILADSGRTAGEGPFPGAKDPYSNPDNFDQRYQTARGTASGQGALPGVSGDFGALNGRIASFCSDGDLTCAAPQNISLLQLAVNVGRQLNVDALQRDGLTPATGQDVAVTLGRIALAAFADIQSQDNWMKSDETFLDVLLRVSDPDYQPGTAKKPVAKADSIASDNMSPLAYLPQKVFNEIIGLIVTNQNTIPVVMSDPYQLTLGPDHTGHHFDYWKDSDSADGKPLTSAEYAAAWLTHLAQQAQAGEPVDKTAKPQDADVAAVQRAAIEAKSTPTTTAKSTTTAKPTTTTKPSTTTATTTATKPSTTQPTTTKPTEAAKSRTSVDNSTTTTAPSTTTPAPTTTVPPAASSVDATTGTTTPPAVATPPARNSAAAETPAQITTVPPTTTTTTTSPSTTPTTTR